MVRGYAATINPAGNFSLNNRCPSYTRDSMQRIGAEVGSRQPARRKTGICRSPLLERRRWVCLLLDQSKASDEQAMVPARLPEGGYPQTQRSVLLSALSRPLDLCDSRNR
jgi:hypothetical protein